MSVEKKVKLQLVGLDGNAFSLLGAFIKQAKKEGWTKEEISEVQSEAMSGDYDHLLCVLSDHCEYDEDWEQEVSDEEIEECYDEYDDEDDEEYDEDEED